MKHIYKIQHIYQPIENIKIQWRSERLQLKTPGLYICRQGAQTTFWSGDSLGTQPASHQPWDKPSQPEVLCHA